MKRLKDAEIDELDADPEEGLKRFYDRLEKESTRPEDPERVRKCKRMAERTIELSEIYEIDTDVVRGTWYISVTMYLDCADYMVILKNRFAELFSLCDDFAFFQIPQSERDITLSLTCYSHSHWQAPRGGAVRLGRAGAGEDG